MLCHDIQVEARGSALERLRDENESLTEDYNKLRCHSAALEDQARATIADLERQVADACRSAAEAGVSAAAAHALAHQDSSVSALCAGRPACVFCDRSLPSCSHH